MIDTVDFADSINKSTLFQVEKYFWPLGSWQTVLWLSISHSCRRLDTCSANTFDFANFICEVADIVDFADSINELILLQIEKYF